MYLFAKKNRLLEVSGLGWERQRGIWLLGVYMLRSRRQKEKEILMTYSIVNFYCFKALTQLEDIRRSWKELALKDGLLGTVLVAPEGINCALSGEKAALERFVRFAHEQLECEDLCPKWSQADQPPFKRLKVKIKRWIIRFAEDSDPSLEAIHEAPRWTPAEVLKALESGRDDLVVVDTRNGYETEVGAFEGAVQLPIRTFTQFPDAFLDRFRDQKDKTFLFYCTGGVRCEKVVPWAMAQGFKHATQLDGGILKYFEEVGAKHYDKGCFVFDERVLLGSE